MIFGPVSWWVFGRSDPADPTPEFLNGLHDRCRRQTIPKDLTSDRDLIKVATSALNACLTEAQKARQIISKTNNIVKN
jgi:hypothetical protein